MKIATENPGADRIVAEKWVVWRECFRMAKLMLQEQEPMTFEDREAREHYYAAVPGLASQLHDQMMGGTAFVAQASEKDQIERFDHAAAIVRSMQTASEQVERALKAKGGHE